jgi:hypothetical protein
MVAIKREWFLWKSMVAMGNQWLLREVTGFHEKSLGAKEVYDGN